jgi:CRISPR-associated protein Cmr1
MLTRTYTLRFVTPAFLGNAEQQAQWRTPPIKAMIRQWWRVVKGPKLAREFDVSDLRRAEAALFGVATDRNDISCRSLLQLRLQHWNCGALDGAKWPSRREIGELQVGQGRIPADVYIGFGPVLAASRKENRPAGPGRTAIAPDTSNELSIALDQRVTEVQCDEVFAALTLCHWFGTLGSRSRNGWGSLDMADDGLSRMPSVSALQPYLRRLESCFTVDWAHAIGQDRKGPLVWIGNVVKTWPEAILSLAQTRLAIRAAAKKLGRSRDISANQLISYPVTQSGNGAWGPGERFASPLRLKVHRTDRGLVPIAFHLPCALPPTLLAKLGIDDQRWIHANQIPVWQAVHQDLDQRMRRLGDAK